MASVKVAPKIPFALHDGSSNARDDPYSNYLSLARENFPPELRSPERLSCQISVNRRRTPDGEIEIFDAEKYFSGVLDRSSGAATPQRLPSVLGLETPPVVDKEVQAVRPVRARSSRAGSTSSEASCNSRSMLLRDNHRRPAAAPSVQRTDAAGKGRFAGVFPCSSCARKNAIDVADKDASTDAVPDNYPMNSHALARPHVEHLVSDLRLKRISPGLKQDAFVFLSIPKEEKAAGVSNNAVFGARYAQKGDMLSVQRKSFGIRPSGKVAGASGGRDHGDDDDDEDVRSEESSDLFEIESLSMNSHPLVTCEGSESMTTTGYEPSEASVEWSVVTASVANFSIASETDDHTATLRRARRPASPGLLLGCVSEKAVGVTAGPATRKSVDRRECGVLDRGVTPTARYRVESCGVDLGGSGLRAGRVLPPSPFGSSRSSQEY